MSGLPQELIDRIIDHLHDRESLKACSLVCSQWSARSRKHLFVQVDFPSAEGLERWCACIPPGPSGPSSLVKDLIIYGDDTSPSTFWLGSSILSTAASHLQSFSALRMLVIWRGDMSTDCVSSMLRSFGSSLENVTRLTVGHVAIRPSTLMMFVSHFPRLDDLSLSRVHPPSRPTGADDLDYGFDGDVVPSHPRGKFFAVDDWEYQVPKGVFEGIALLKPRFHLVSLAYVSYGAWRDYWPVVEACGGSLEELRILADATGE